MEKKSIQRDVLKALKIALLAAFGGSILASILLCIVLLFWVRSPDDMLAVPAAGMIAGLAGLLVSIPAALLLGAPLVWFFGDRLAGSPRQLTALLALLGGVAGWIIFRLMFNEGFLAGEVRLGCLIFGAVIAGLHAPLAAWLAQPAGPEAPSLSSD